MSSVEIKSVDFTAVRQAADSYASRLLLANPGIEEIVVFGSFANDRYVPGSDLDVLIVLTHSDIPVRDRIPDLLPDRFPVPLDLFPFTRAELSERAASPMSDAFARSDWRYRR